MASTTLTITSELGYDYLNPSLEGITLEHIAHSLAKSPRFIGHGNYTLTTAAHSVGVWWRVAQMRRPLAEQRQAIMHDTQEVLVCDVPSPLKAAMRAMGSDVYDRIEADAWRLICEKYDIRYEIYPSVKLADGESAILEAEAGFGSLPGFWGSLERPTGMTLPKCWDYAISKQYFLAACDYLGICD